MRLFVIVAIGLLAGCGTDGPPERPVKSGVSLSGEVQMGVRSN
jgi:predicted small lipoprotein YifL